MESLTFHHSAREKQGASRGLLPRLCRASRRARGFTMVELMAVVVIIGILMVIAVPGIAHRMQEYHSQQAANEIAALYRNARSRAMARGSAVIVRWAEASQSFDVYEALGNAAQAGCAPRVSTSCVNAPALQLVNHFTVTTTGDNTAKVMSPAGASASAQVANMDVCFSPVGATRFRTSNNNAAAVSSMDGVTQVLVSRPSGRGLTRSVLWLPNGTARVIVPDTGLVTP